jgi:DNA-binding transcriptional LysR family regulator
MVAKKQGLRKATPRKRRAQRAAEHAVNAEKSASSPRAVPEHAAQAQEAWSTLRWDDVRIFLAIARERSLGLAGRRLGLDTSTVSRRLGALEEALGARLFERARHGLVATRTAEQMFVRAEEVEASHARLLRAVSALEQVAEGTVRLSVPPGMADAFIVPVLRRLRAQHPRISLELDTSLHAVDLTRHEADLALRSLAPRGAELVVTRLLRLPWVVAASAELARELGTLSALRDAPWIDWDHDLASFTPSVWLARHARGATVVLRTSPMGAQLRAAELGLGLLLVPEPYLKTHALVPVRIAADLAQSIERLPEGELWLVGHRATRETPRIAAVWEVLLTEFRKLVIQEARG